MKTLVNPFLLTVLISFHLPLRKFFVSTPDISVLVPEHPVSSTLIPQEDAVPCLSDSSENSSNENPVVFELQP
ncbi:MAG: hypothetical protein LPK45_08080 [Bacteroidota bacterium]|nr:hypothetical protein [Bacteroidota bacterium]MDX5431029.1 hypothetical protein [Bacteroidota bacterium]MDX5469779.1 hypothetical protein [Bacteroidota bacterium]